MSALNFKPVFEEIASLISDQSFSSMYFGRHCGKSVLILKHELTLLLVFEDDFNWSRQKFVKSVSFRGNPGKGIKIVGSENVVLLLDKDGNLWRLINAFEVSVEKNECLHSLEENCFYEWVPFKKFNFAKILDISAFGCGFACIGLCWNSEKKLVVMPSSDSVLEDYTFEGLSTTNSSSYYLTNLNINIKNSVYKNLLSAAEELLLLVDRFTGKFYLCSERRTNSLLYRSDIYLVSVLHFEKEKCLMFCFENGKLIFSFYNESMSHHVVYLSRKLFCVEKCCCMESCFLWSDGIKLRHTKLVFGFGDMRVKLSHLKLNSIIMCPISLLKVNQNVLTATINRTYYCVSRGLSDALEIHKEPQEVLSEIHNGSLMIGELQEKIDKLTYYLTCQEIIQKNKAKVEISWEGNKLLLKCCAGDFLRDFWKVKLTKTAANKNLVKMVDLDSDLKKGMLIAVENPFKSKSEMKVSLVGDFQGNNLFLYLGEVGKTEADSRMFQLSKQLKEILAKRNPCVKEGENKYNFS